MTVQMLNRAIGDVDDLFISDAETYFSDQRRQKRQRMRMLVLVAAILTAVIAIGCVAVSYFELNDVLKEHFGIVDEYDEELGAGVTAVGESRTVGGFTVTIDQIFGDPHTLWIVFRTILPEDVPLRPDPEKNIYSTHNGDFLSVQLFSGSSGGGYGWKCVDIDDETRTKTYILQLSGTPDNLIGKKLTLIFDYEWMDKVGWPTWRFAGIRDEEGNPTTIEITVYAKYRDMTKTFHVGRKFGEYEVKEVRISPASTIVRISGLPDEQQYIKACSLTMKDGTAVECYDFRSIKKIWWNGSFDVYSSNYQIVDPSEVKEVTFSVDEETFYTIDLE